MTTAFKKKFSFRVWPLLGVLMAVPHLCWGIEANPDLRPGLAPDIREDDTRLKAQRGDFVIVPIPIADPTLENGLILGSAYFYPQTEAQKKTQPASLTAVAAMYTSSDSKAIGIAQQNYWLEDRWRFTGAIGAADLRLPLLAPSEGSSSIQGTSSSYVDWRIRGEFLYGKLSTRLGHGDWYGGVSTRMVSATQSIAWDQNEDAYEFDLGESLTSSGLGLLLEYDSRDNPFNTASGAHFAVDMLFNDERVGSSQTYQSYSVAGSAFKQFSDRFVVAWEADSCKRAGDVPLWDVCRVALRGFSATDYMAKNTASTQLEGRWQFTQRWGMVVFSGVGYAGSTFDENGEYDPIPSVGAGLRFMVLKAKKINMRLDFAKSNDSDAVYFSVGESF